MKRKIYDRIIIGAGLYGLYSAYLSIKRGLSVLVIEYDNEAFGRASYINQARVHLGYHYPRSIATALNSKKYYNRFLNDFSESINNTFEKVYATSRSFSWTSSEQFQKFCNDAEIPCKPIQSETFFNSKMIDGAFITEESSFDANILKNELLNVLNKSKNFNVMYGFRIKSIKQKSSSYLIQNIEDNEFEAPFLVNASYASINQIHRYLKLEPLSIKYELCEVILVKINSEFQDIGITIMDGPFFSLMPFGKTGLHSLTSVNLTPHLTSTDRLPTFPCQLKSNGRCSSNQLDNCNTCALKPESSWIAMEKITQKYLSSKITLTYKKSLFSMKTVLNSSEIDDSRPTLIKKITTNPTFISILSGKINTIYDLEEFL